ncbi:MAG: MBOAT family protein [Pseudobutyrivibrio sp.]|nr:MBOAT family protein [Pseudobutyrivibrio sp.]
MAIEKVNDSMKRVFLTIGVVFVVIPWFFTRDITAFSWGLIKSNPINLVIPMGISFYTLQIIAYMVDVYKGKVQPQRNLLKYVLFISYFPQILQGPIPRYEQLQNQLVEGHKFDEHNFSKGICYIIWGFFLKLVIADKAGVFVNTVYGNYPAYAGAYLWVASILYSIQLYADFLACTILAKGVSKLFGVELIDNFMQPYFATSIKDFWRRWHISLSTWLRDYIYIPLGGNRKGQLSKFMNLLITFFISGLWHGAGFRFIAWGMLHAFYQIIGELTNPVREEIYVKLRVAKDSKDKAIFKRIGTFLLVDCAWVLFRADSLRQGLGILKNMFFVLNPWVLFNNRIYTLGLDWKDWLVLILGILVMIYAGIKHEAGISVTDAVIARRLPIRWAIMIAAIVVVMLMGTYGYGFNNSDFIYGGF